ncbi:hypothetical protein PL373_03720 [Tenacibaculum maritimum]|nr:hypothetical protein [Tenacibaculum maritimum]MDB0600262.1 hypothetical protein [Tenacibaculum maritimum]MDB0610772.1 hypothetical protein [Tenacibaculum maritimum]
MKNLFPKLLIVIFLTTFTFSCSSDDDSDNSSNLEDVEGTTWYRQETTTQSGQTIEIDFHLVFQTSNTGYLEADTNAVGTNINQTYDFSYVYSQGNGTANFDDSNIGIQDFTISGDQLTLDGETLTRQ